MKIKVTLEEYLDTNFTTKSRPSLGAMRKRCRNGHYKNAVKEGRIWYLVVDTSTGDKRADEIIAKLNKTKS